VDVATIARMLQQGWLTTVPLALCSVLVLAVMIERMLRYRGIEKGTRDLTRSVVEALGKRDLSTANALCQTAKTPVAQIFRKTWRGRTSRSRTERILATSRQENTAELRRGLWVIGTIGSLAPFIGLFGTVVGIMKAFHQIAVEGSGGFEVVASGISEALIATAVGLGVAIVALAFYNYLNVKIGLINNGFARACERLVQALLRRIVRAPPPDAPGRHGHHSRLAPTRRPATHRRGSTSPADGSSSCC
jgi:biopolymer transport protein ExbB